MEPTGLETITKDVRNALDARFYYVAIMVALTLPDVCAALEAPNGEATGPRYKAWCDAWLVPKYPLLTATDLYSLRCGVVHQGRMGHKKMQYSRVIFTLPNPFQRNAFWHNNVANDALNLDARAFCEDVLASVLEWYEAKQNDPHVKANVPRLVQYRARGIAGLMEGMPLIS